MPERRALLKPLSSGEAILRSEGVRGIRTRMWLLRQLFRVALKVEPDGFISLCRHMAQGDYGADDRFRAAPTEGDGK